MVTVPGGPTISCPHKCGKIWGPQYLGKLLFKDIVGWPLPLQRVNEGPERGGVVPQTTQMMQDRVVAFQLPAVLPERVPGGLGHASASLVGSLLSASSPHSLVCV